MIAAKQQSAKINIGGFDDMPILRRKWQAAVRLGEGLPRYEEVMVGSLGRIADHIVLLRNDDDAFVISRSGSYAQQWLGDERWGIRLDALPPDCATVLSEAGHHAICNGRPHQAVAHCVRDGMVRTYDVLALPTASRWGGTLVGAYVNERGSQFNLLDAIFATTDDGVISLATIRDAAGEPFDFQIVHHNEGAATLLQASSAQLQWRRLSGAGNLLCSPAVVARLRDAVVRGAHEQFEIDSDDRCLRLAVTAFADILALTISDVTPLKRREASFRLLFDNNPMPMWVFNAESTQFLSVNDAAVQHYGYSREKFLTMRLREIWPEDEWMSHSQALQQIGDSYRSERHWRHLKADGGEIQVLTFGRRVSFDGRDGYLVAMVDITERRKAEARIAYMAHHTA